MNLISDSPKGIELFIPPIHEIVISAICLIIIFYIIIKFAVPKFYKILDNRAENISQKVDNANKIMEDAKVLKDKTEKKYEKLKNIAKQTHKEAHEQAQEILKDTKDKANLEYLSIIKNAKAKIKNDKKQSIKEVENYAKEKSVILAKKILNEALNDKKVTDKIFDNMVKS